MPVVAIIWGSRMTPLLQADRPDGSPPAKRATTQDANIFSDSACQKLQDLDSWLQAGLINSPDYKAAKCDVLGMP